MLPEMPFRPCDELERACGYVISNVGFEIMYDVAVNAIQPLLSTGISCGYVSFSSGIRTDTLCNQKSHPTLLMSLNKPAVACSQSCYSRSCLFWIFSGQVEVLQDSPMVGGTFTLSYTPWSDDDVDR